MSSEYKRVRDYELMVIFHPELSEEDLQGEITKVEGHITSGEGTVTLINRETPWGRRRLSYAIRHDSRDIRDGFYVLYYFTAESTRLAEMEREIKLQDRILRYLMTQQIAPIMEPAAEEEEAASDEAAGEATPAADTPATEAATEVADTNTEALGSGAEAAPDAVEEVAAEAPAEEVAAEEVTVEAPVEEVAAEEVASEAPAKDAATENSEDAAVKDEA
jgi:small subunit ribosomal protein S6